MKAVSIEVGSRAPERVFGPMTLQMFVRYAGASGDLNPIHYDESFAKSSGYRSVFSQGMHQAALVATIATDSLGTGRIRRFQLRFKDQVWPGDMLTCAGEVVAVGRGDQGPFATLSLTCTRQTGTVAVVGEADFLCES